MGEHRTTLIVEAQMDGLVLMDRAIRVLEAAKAAIKKANRVAETAKPRRLTVPK